METVLVREYRSDLLECVHSGHIAIVGENGNVKGYAGDPEFVSFTRSAAKPLQAIPGIRGGIVEHYGFTPAEVALMTASHRGESYHVAALESISSKIGIDEQQMICATSYPLDYTSRENAIAARAKESSIITVQASTWGFYRIVSSKDYHLKNTLSRSKRFSVRL